MGISLTPKNLKRFKDIGWLLMKYGRGDLVKKSGLDEIMEPADAEPANAEPAGDEPPQAKALAADLEKMGPTFIKLGQLLSTRPDLLPAPYLATLARLQDKVEPFSFAEVEEIVTAELGVRISKAFSRFDDIPVAAASLGQVHHAVLRDGRPVAVKVQRPDIRPRIAADLEALEDLAEFFDQHTEMGKRYEFQKMLEEFRKSLLRELDYREEARNLKTLRNNLTEFDAIVIPAPIEDYTTSRVLTMDYICGKKITALSPLAKMEIDGVRLAEQLFRAYLKQTLVDGFFHADPHPGNVFLTDDAQIALLDLGMVGYITPNLQERLLQMLLAVSEGRAEDAATVAIGIGERREAFDESEFRRRVADLVMRHQNLSVQDIQLGASILEVGQVAGQCGMRLPPELTMLGKTLLNLDQVGRTLDPNFDPNESIRRNAAEIMQQRMRKSLSPGNLFGSLPELKTFAEKLPQRFNKSLDKVADNELEIKVNAIDEHRLMEGLQKVANRITLGLVLAALIIGAAMLMRLPTSFMIFGYPGLAMIFFLAAAGGGSALALNILYHDERRRARAAEGPVVPPGGEAVRSQHAKPLRGHARLSPLAGWRRLGARGAPPSRVRRDAATRRVVPT